MAAGNFTMFNGVKLKTFEKLVDWGDDDLKVTLHTSAQALTAAFTGGSGNCQYSDLTAELTTTGGYTAGGISLANVQLTEVAGELMLDCDDPEWLALSATFKYAVVRNNTMAAGDLMGFWNLNTAGGSITIAGVDWSINVHPDGLFTGTGAQ